MNDLLMEQQRQVEAAQQATIQQFANYDRENTGDYQTPDVQAAELGVQLCCQHFPAQCQQLAQRGHELRMNDIRSFGDTSRSIGETNGGIIDRSHEGYANRSVITDRGHSDHVQGAIQEPWSFVNPSNGGGYDLPIQPDPQTQYATPDGYPLSFDYDTGTPRASPAELPHGGGHDRSAPLKRLGV